MRERWQFWHWFRRVRPFNFFFLWVIVYRIIITNFCYCYHFYYNYCHPSTIRVPVIFTSIHHLSDFTITTKIYGSYKIIIVISFVCITLLLLFVFMRYIFIFIFYIVPIAGQHIFCITWIIIIIFSVFQ